MQSSRPAGRIGNQKSVGLGIYPIYTGYILPFNRDKTHWVIPQISIHATDTYRDIPCTNNPVWVIPCLSQVHSNWPKDIPGITFWCSYTLYILVWTPTSQVIQRVSDSRCLLGYPKALSSCMEVLNSINKKKKSKDVRNVRKKEPLGYWWLPKS